MRPPSKEKDQILRELTEVFRDYGYDGATLSKLTEKTGLERASLYHYFPGGKRAMAEAVLERVLGELKAKVLQTLTSDLPPLQRLASMLKATDRFYNGGQDLCFVTIFAIGENSERLTESLQVAVAAWSEALQKTLEEADFEDPQRLALASLACIQGGLILSGVTKDPKPFQDALEFLAISWLSE